MVGALIEFTKDGRVKAVYMIGANDQDQAIAEHGLARIVQPRCWNWLRRLLKGDRCRKPIS